MTDSTPATAASERDLFGEQVARDNATAHRRVEYRVVCPDGNVTSQPDEDYQDAHDIRAIRDESRGNPDSLHRDCGPHRVQERIVTYGEWQ